MHAFSSQVMLLSGEVLLADFVKLVGIFGHEYSAYLRSFYCTMCFESESTGFCAAKS